IKNYWNTHIRKRLLKNGIDPVTHAPRLDLLDLSSILTSALCNPAILNLSNLLGTHEALLNPEILRVVKALTTLKQENPENLLHYLQQNQLYNNNNYSQSQIQTQLVPTTSQQPANNNNQYQPLSQSNVGESSHNFNCSSMSNIVTKGNLNPNDPNYEYGCSNPTAPENSSLQGLNNGNLYNQSFNFDSLMSTPISSPTPLNSSSTNNLNTTEDERDSYCSSLLKFEIPESLDISDFM
ncbi:transcription factor MYB102-like, partial [Rutidosis leptorrhynchoides]|uniref:transcription factor MYB102-like n=1 Tax=Rutidosis leptorrhynchoides TaxID=125765 RepID=UPI003A9986C0